MYSSSRLSPPSIRVSPPGAVRNLSPPQALNLSTYSDRMYGVDDGQRRYEELLNENLWLRDQIDRKRQGHPFETHPVYMRNIHEGIPLGADRTKNDMVLWSMMERNRFLEDKLAKLRTQQAKQYSTIRKIEHSDEWQSRHVCVPSKCYHDKYMQLLRVRSPFF